MRLLNDNSNTDPEELRTCSEWILNIGDGKVGEVNDSIIDFHIPDDILIRDSNDPLRAIIDSTYHNLIENA